jgi:hypothetical protein
MESQRPPAGKPWPTPFQVGRGSQVERNAAAGASVSEAVTQRARAASYRIESFDINRSACNHRTIVVLPVSDRLQEKGGQHGIQ